MPINDNHDFFIQWHLTERCNLRCTHCYQQDKIKSELPLDIIKQIITEAAEMISAWQDSYNLKLSMSYNVSGGEPFLRGDIFEILQEITRTQADIYILSNGTLITKKTAYRLKMLGIKGVQISIEGPKDIHEKIRGRGSYEAAIEGAENLRDAGVPVTLNATLSTVNSGYFMEMIGLSKSLGVQRLGFSRLVPYGRGKAMLDKMIATEDVKSLYQNIFSADSGRLKIITGDPVASQLLSPAADEDMGNTAAGGCAAGVSGLTILPDGTITPCRRLNIPIGNAATDSLREVWATSEVLENLRDRKKYSGKCGACKRWANCRGCRAIAYAYSTAVGEENYLADDPQCFI